MNFRKINLAEYLALVRIVTFPIILYFIFRDYRITSAILYLILFSTDVFDGLFARLLNLESKRRIQWDTIGDILFLFTGLIGFYVFEKTFFKSKIEWIGLILLLYFAALLFSFIKFKKPSFFHTYLAKVTAVFQVAFLCSMMFATPLLWLFYTTATLSLLDATEDIMITARLKGYRMNIKGYWELC